MHFRKIIQIGVYRQLHNYIKFIATGTMASEFQSGATRKCQCLQGFEDDIFPLTKLTLFNSIPSGDMMNIMLINKYEYCVSVVKLYEMLNCLRI
jgi:hypothetical protein